MPERAKGRKWKNKNLYFKPDLDFIRERCPDRLYRRCCRANAPKRGRTAKMEKCVKCGSPCLGKAGKRIANDERTLCANCAKSIAGMGYNARVRSRMSNAEIQAGGVKIG